VQNSWTALTVATAGGYTDVVRLLLAHHPYVNAVDKVGVATPQGLLFLLLPRS